MAPPPPPSQAGKFKPRKPVKKPKASAVITPGAAAATPATVASSSDVARGPGGGAGRPQSSGQQQSKQPRRSFNQPVPQGSVFFTGNNATAAKKSRSRSAGGRLKKDGGAGGEGGEEEVVVGQLDVAIGSSAALLAKQEQQRAKQAAAESAGDYYADDGNPKPSRKTGSGNNQSGGAALDYILYDSDSDNDLETWSANALQPTQLPIPSNTPALDLMELDHQHEQYLPFQLSEHNAAEHSQWFLFQLPTRLPPLKTKDGDAATAAGAAGSAFVDHPQNDNDDMAAGIESKNEDAVVAAVTPETPEVVTAPILAGSFDNALATAKSGKLGRIQIHKSGKAVLLMDGPEGKVSKLLLVFVPSWIVCAVHGMKILNRTRLFFALHCLLDSNELDGGTFLPVFRTGRHDQH